MTNLDNISDEDLLLSSYFSQFTPSSTDPLEQLINKYLDTDLNWSSEDNWTRSQDGGNKDYYSSSQNDAMNSSFNSSTFTSSFDSTDESIFTDIDCIDELNSSTSSFQSNGNQYNQDDRILKNQSFETRYTHNNRILNNQSLHNRLIQSNSPDYYTTPCSWKPLSDDQSHHDQPNQLMVTGRDNSLNQKGENSQYQKGENSQYQKGENSLINERENSIIRKRNRGVKKIFPCPFNCGSTYSRNSHLKVHVRKHTGEKPFTCNYAGCDWRFRRSDELSRHKRCHSGLKPYTCLICAKSFARSDHLSKHSKIHEKQYFGSIVFAN